MIKHMNLVKRECGSDRCLISIQTLLKFILDEDKTLPGNCRFIDIGKQGDRHVDKNIVDPPCWRDGMLIRSASLL